MVKVCLITTAQPSTNPRLVKEADALVEAGFEVRVVGAHWADWAPRFDEALLATRTWRCDILDWRRGVNPSLFWKTRIRHFVARTLARVASIEPLVEEAALSRIGRDLRPLALRERADLFIAHNLGALPAALAAGRAFGVPVGFDAEDFHSGQFWRPAESGAASTTRTAERRLLPQCAYVTAAAPGIADAYRELCAVPPPTCILNVFPLRERPRRFRPSDPRSPVRLHWYSQTVGPDRGLEDAVRAMGLLKTHPLELHLRGRWQAGYEPRLRQLAADHGVDVRQIVGHDPAASDQLAVLASDYDVGLALEPGVSRNNDIALSNKIFTYVLAGNAVLATRTSGQGWLAPQLHDAVALCEPGQPESLAAALRPWLEHRERLDAARLTAWHLGESRFNWDHEKSKLLDVVDRILDRRAA
jgi:glycosyltransferase involved in cell wall biosynthesis